MIGVTHSKENRNVFYRRAWLDFRNGHGIYLVFIMTFANFITIQYKLLIEQSGYLETLFNNIWLFAATFIIIYVPVAIGLGYWHRKSQWKVEAEAMFRENEVSARLWLFMIDLIDGKVTEEEKKTMRDMLSTIAKSRTA